MQQHDREVIVRGGKTHNPNGARRRAVAITAVCLTLVTAAGACSDGDDDDAAVATTTLESSTEAATGSSLASADAAPTTTSATTTAATTTEAGSATDAGTQDDTSEVAPVSDAVTVAPATATAQDEAPLPTPPIPVAGTTIPAELDSAVDFGTGVVAAVTDVEAVEVVGRLPGERSGPGVRISIEVTNGSDEQISLDFVTVDLINSEGASAIPVEEETPRTFSGSLEPGASAVGVYQFFIPSEQRASAFLTVNYASDQPTALFSGDLPDA
jgi:hypothetical protein